MLFPGGTLASAVEDFRHARQRAALEQLMARFTGRSTNLLPYDDVVRQLKIKNQAERGLHDIPLDAIVGSVGRYKDYTRSFLPRHDADEQRWARVKAAMLADAGLPPIEVYQIGDAYFVRDGNHRVSIARQMGLESISAYVTEVQTRVPLTPDDDPEEIIAKARYANFLEQTELDKSRPEAELLMRFCGHYSTLLEHIEVHRYFMHIDYGESFSFEAAAAHWYDTVYEPILDVIERLGVMRHFPDLFPTDIYILLAEHRAELEQALGWGVDTADAAESLVATSSSQTETVLNRVSSRLLEKVTPDELESGPATGSWREKAERQRRDRLFADILVAGRGVESDLDMLEHAVEIARREDGRLLGLHVVADDTASREEIMEHPEVVALRRRFDERCAAAGIRGEAAVETGDVARVIVERAGWSDLAILHLAHPPGTGTLEQLSSGFTTILHRSPCPVLAVPSGARSTMDHALLAFDGGDKAREALFVAAYAADRWECRLTVSAVGPPAIARKHLEAAQRYLDTRKVTAEYIHAAGNPGPTLIEQADEHHCNLLLLGGFSAHPLRQILVGSTVLGVLRAARQPVLICR